MAIIDRTPAVNTPDLCRVRQQQILQWLDRLVTEAEDCQSPIVVVGTAEAKGVRQLLRDGLA